MRNTSRDSPRFDRILSVVVVLLRSVTIPFGFNFSESDSHIIDAINKAAHFDNKRGGKLFSVYIGVYSDADLEHIESIRKQFKCKVNIYNAQTANIW